MASWMVTTRDPAMHDRITTKNNMGRVQAMNESVNEHAVDEGWLPDQIKPIYVRELP